MEHTLKGLEKNIGQIIQQFDDLSREGLKDTPKRYISFLQEFLTQDKEFNFTVFTSEGMDEMIVQKNIPFYSLCEHHLVPFFGIAHVAYIPNEKIVGLSKLARCVDHYARSFQNQERITQQVAERIEQELAPKGVAVVMEAEHLCMAMRGIKKQGATTITSKMIGAFKADPKCRAEFMQFIK